MADTLRNELQAALGDAYAIERELGGGGMSRVFVAEEMRFHRRVVIKVLSPELAAGLSAERFEREIGLAAGLQQANIVPVITAGDVGGLPWYSMPFVDGLSLRARLERNGALSIAEAVSVLRDVSRALAYAHERGVVHRDIKPENILLSGDAAVVTDFGIAKALSASRTQAPGGTLTQVGTSIGTPAYMAPEQAAGDPATDHRADIYALGCVAFEMLSGAAPFAGRPTHQLFAAHLNETPPLLSGKRADVSQLLATLVARCLEKDPARRPQSAREIITALESAASGVHVARKPVSLRPVIAIAACALVGIAVAWYLLDRRGATSATADSKINSIAVLPFENASGDTASNYFADGMAEELTLAIDKLPGLRVASRSAAFAFRGRQVSAQDAGRALRVGAVLEGTVRRANGRLRVSAQLTNVADGLSLWSDAFERADGEVFSTQDDLARRIAGALHDKLAIADAPRNVRTDRGTKDEEAYDLYLRGRYLWAKRGGESLRAAAALFSRAISRDSTFARAWAGLAMVQVVLPQYITTPDDTLIQAGMRNARRAIVLDQNLADAYSALGYGALARSEWGLSESSFRKALMLEPDNAGAHHWYGDMLYARGKLTEALAELNKAQQLDPTSTILVSEASNTLYLMRRYDESIAAGRRAIEMDSLLPIVYSNFALAYTFRGQPDSAVSLLRRAERFKGGYISINGLPYALTKAGRRDEAAALVREMEAAATRGATPAFVAAVARLGIGDREGTLRWLKLSAQRHEPEFVINAPGCDPIFDSIKSDARFLAYVAQVGAALCP